MKKRILAMLAVAALGLTLASSAVAFDCIRVSSSLQGLQNSTRSGRWLLFNLSSAASVQQTFASIGGTATDEQAACVASTYAASGYTPYFALGIGVAGANNPRAAAGGVIAHNNPNSRVLSNLRGIDHLDDSPIGGALFGALAPCGIPLG